MREIHWLMNMLTNMDVGIVVFDRQGQVIVWNHFMENHSGISSTEIKEQGSLFDVYPIFKERWLQNKIDSALLLDCEMFVSWEQVPHLFDFAAYRPVTGSATKMYQNITVNALKDASGEASYISMMVYDVSDVAVNKQALEKINRELELSSRTDKLTGLFNRGYWQEKLSEAVQLHARYETAHSLILFDIDHFKRVNDSYGHQAGDEVIRQVADSAAQSARVMDVVGRYGGEEFGIILPETDAEGARVLGERLRQEVETLQIPFEREQLTVTISLGIASLNSSMLDEDKWLQAADEALYQAKEQGRNQVVVHKG
ncbi:sensor domain-containing diguanylate cyclase [Pseudomaricurvus alkylphenolicus]|jgi:diguanylate cyclase (GGDEF)-like protein|uniref:sensor domain-containing diguanylate cyclase n=1 Tax=Pseudomaricurvus alkylphenolicus TaxID=1306991 RepID=UPI00197ED8C8|nr:sensor domain-containing diguanylate cyclase [Pseudomaricurvus alkylphenolicus]